MLGNYRLKKRIKHVITNSRILLRLLRLLSGDMPKVFVWHRFSAPGENIFNRMSADEFGWQLDQINRDFQVLSFGEMLEYFNRHGNWPRRCVVLTIDDGYRDFYRWAFPELKKRGMKATYFATVNFVEGKIWLWPDRLQWVLDATGLSGVTLKLHDETHIYPLVNQRDKTVVWKTCSDHCITLPDEQKEMFIRSLEEALQVSCPEVPTEEYRAVTWAELREMGNHGIEIGSHTMNHPILSRIGPEILKEEVCGSREILREKLDQEISTFCYPNSAPGDITGDVVEQVRNAGYSGAVFGIDLKTWDPYQVPRMGVSAGRADFLWKLYGGESI